MILTSFIEGILLGLGAAVPLGAINILVMNTALRRYSAAVAIGVGAITSDITYLIVILFGFLHFVDNPNLTNAMTIVGALFMMYLALMVFKNRNEPIHAISTKKMSLWRYYIKGYMLTLINPYSIVFWFSVSAYISSKELNVLATVAGLLLSTSSWVTFMPLVIHKTKHLISQRMATLFSIFSTIILMFFAMGMFWKLIK
jgi:L-lysine exporter family protein LysE/ArgO